MQDPQRLRRFTDEVLRHGAEACLPVNLSDEWLEVLDQQAENAVNGANEAGMSELVAVILHLVAHKNGRSSDALLIDEALLFERIAHYQMEIAIEEINRQTDMVVERATLETIFTHRPITPIVRDA